MGHAQTFFSQVSTIAAEIDYSKIDLLAHELAALRARRGRLFVLGVGGSAANASHAVCDFRKLCDIEAYAPTDNVSELTARANDDGWDTVFTKYLEINRLTHWDAIFVLSVGGGNVEHNVSTCIVKAVDMAVSFNVKVLGIVGRVGYTALHGNIVIMIPMPHPALMTPLSETFQAAVWHCLVSHPKLQVNPTKW